MHARGGGESLPPGNVTRKGRNKMNSINSVALSGNLVRDPELRMTGNGTAVLNFSIAVNESRKTGDTWEDVPSYIDCVVFGKQAEHLQQNVSKGFRMFVQGKMRQRSWEKDGQKRSTIEVVVERVEYKAPKGRVQSGGASTYDAAYEDEELPF